jgi:hypothetical protein
MIVAFLNVTPCSLAAGNQSVRKTNCLQIQEASSGPKKFYLFCVSVEIGLSP